MQPAKTKQLFACQLPRYEESDGGGGGSGYEVLPCMQQHLVLGNEKVATHSDPVRGKHLMVERPPDSWKS